MNKVIYSSLYNYIDLFNLKNLVFLFDEVVIPTGLMFLVFDEKSPNPSGRAIQLIPDKVFDQIRFLEMEGVVKTQSLQESPWGEFPTLLSAINQGASKAGRMETSKTDLDEFYQAFKLNSSNEQHSTNLNVIAAALASHSLGSTLTYGACSFSDNDILYQLGQCGLREIIHTIDWESVERPNVNEVTSNRIISKLSEIYMPIEACINSEHYKGNSACFQNAVTSLSLRRCMEHSRLLA